MKKTILLAFLVSLSCYIYSLTPVDSLCIVEYNVENFFHPDHDSLKNDYEFTPDGKYRWTLTRYYRKIEQLSRVITNIGGTRPPAIVGLCEVENETCVKDLCKAMPHYKYHYIFHEGPDRRGIDVAILYDKTQVNPIATRTYRVFNDGKNFTRDIIYTQLQIVGSTDTIHLFMGHLPSQLGGTKETEWKREAAKDIIRHLSDSILTVHQNAHILAMGDFNTQPKEDIKGLSNCMLSWAKKGIGTHRWQGQWSCLDQVYLSASLKDKISLHIFQPDWIMMKDKKWLGFSPKRTFVGNRYNRNGYSDHLPVYMYYYIF